jgi:flagellar M-ring protein FliF
MAMDDARTTAQLRARLAQFSAPQKTIVALLAIVGIVATAGFFRWVTAPSYEVLMTGLSATDAAAVTEELTTAGVAYKLEGGGTTVLVPSESVQEQRLAVAAAGLPEGTTKGYELLDAQGMTSSSFQQKVAYQRAVEGELSKTLEQMKEVRTATVHLSVPEKELYTDKSEPARASVLLETSGTMDGDTVDSVQRLVAAAVPDLVPEGVTVSDTKGTLLSSDGGTGDGAEAQQALEDAAVARADSMLTSVLGAGKAVVRVNAELDTASRTTESESYDPTKSVTLRKDSSKESYNGGTGTGTAEGTVSVTDPAPNGGDGTTGSTTGAKNDYSKDDVQEEYGVTRQVDKTTEGPGALKRLTVAVVVDERAAGLTNQAVQDLVSNAVGVDPARGDTISVATAAFPADAGATAAARAAAPQDWVRLGTIALAGFLLLVITLTFLRAARRGTVAEIPLTDLQLSPEAAPILEAAANHNSKALEASRNEAEQDLRVLELVDSRPDEVSALIRSWLAEPVEVKK